MTSESCPNCLKPTVQRVGGEWCPRCRGWVTEFQVFRNPVNGEPKYIRTLRRPTG